MKNCSALMVIFTLLFAFSALAKTHKNPSRHHKTVMYHKKVLHKQLIDEPHKTLTNTLVAGVIASASIAAASEAGGTAALIQG